MGSQVTSPSSGIALQKPLGFSTDRFKAAPHSYHGIFGPILAKTRSGNSWEQHYVMSLEIAYRGLSTCGLFPKSLRNSLCGQGWGVGSRV